MITGTVMQTGFGRTDRIADVIQHELAKLIRDEVRDPRVGLVNITGVEISRDLSHAKVFVTQVGLDDRKAEQMVEVLNGAAGFLRTQLSKTLSIRTTPKLKFHFDESSRNGQRLSALIDQALDHDKQRRARFGQQEED